MCISDEENSDNEQGSADDWDDSSGSDKGDGDDWDDWDEEGSGEIGNEAVSAELGAFVVGLEASGVLGPGGLQAFESIDDDVFELLNWALMTYQP